MDKVFIWDADGLQPIGNWKTIVLWRGFSDGITQDIVSIPQLIEKNADVLRARYLAWVFELGEQNHKGQRLIDHLQLRGQLSYWWMTDFVEKCNYSKSPEITDAIRLLAFSDWADRRNLGCVTLASANQSLAECMRLWCKISEIKFEWKRLPKPKVHLSWPRRAYAALPVAIQGMTWLVYYLVDRWPLRGVGIDEWQHTKGTITFISYLFNLIPEAKKNGHFESPYWAHLPNALQNEGNKTNWLHIYVKDPLLPNSEMAANSIRDFNSSGRGLQTHTSLDAFLSARVVFRSLSDWGRLLWNSKRLQNIAIPAAHAKIELWPLFVDDWRQSTFGVSALRSLINLNLFQAAMISLPQQKVGVYLQENQGWEFAFIHEWKASGHGRLIGAPHSSVRFWDLRYFFDIRSYNKCGNCPMPLPDRVALNGKAAINAYQSGGYPIKELLQVEALRYLHLDKTVTSTIVNDLVAKKCFRLLVLGDYVAINTRNQMRLLEQAWQALPANIIITVKPHPACPINPADYPNLRMNIVMEPISELLAICDAAYTSVMTSAALDAFCAGVNVISLLDATMLNLSPLRGAVGVSFVSTPNQLALALKSISHSQRGNVNIEDYFTINRELPLWRKIFVDAG